jgi:RimJ/RimL family protein N-acetyltransferase
MTYQKQTLLGRHIRLEPLEEKHRTGISEAIMDGELWQLPFTFIPHPTDMDSFYEKANNDMAGNNSLVFATVDAVSGDVVGSTRFMNTNWKHKRLEIGFTFIAQSWQRSAVNTEAKYLMLQYAFEQLNFNRVELLTDVINEKSRKAILRIGAVEEGRLRHHMIMPDGRHRDSVVFSIIQLDWPEVKLRLHNMMTQYDNA